MRLPDSMAHVTSTLGSLIAEDLYLLPCPLVCSRNKCVCPLFPVKDGLTRHRASTSMRTSVVPRVKNGTLKHYWRIVVPRALL